MPELHLLPGAPESKTHDGEVLTCAFSTNGQYVLAGGWDGHLSLWDTATGGLLGRYPAGAKPICACAISPDDQQWLSGSMDGLLATWDAGRQYQLSLFLAHTRPISALIHSHDGQRLASASWDRSVILWKTGKERESRTLAGHEDIVAGCAFGPEDRQLLSWSHDTTLRLWDVHTAKCLAVLTGHVDRVTAAAIAPDGSSAVSMSRDGVLKVWDLTLRKEQRSAKLRAEPRACFILLDGERFIVIDAHGRIMLNALHDGDRAELATRLPVVCASLSPTGALLALGCEDGLVRFVEIAGVDEAPLVANATQTIVRISKGLQRFFGKSTSQFAYSCTCPACRQPFQFAKTVPTEPSACPHCSRSLRIRALQEALPDRVH